MVFKLSFFNVLDSNFRRVACSDKPLTNISLGLFLAAIVWRSELFRTSTAQGIQHPAGDRGVFVVRLVTARTFATALAGAVAGVAAGVASVRSLEGLFFSVAPTDPRTIAIPAATIAVAAVLASLPAVLDAVWIDPVEALRAEQTAGRCAPNKSMARSLG